MLNRLALAMLLTFGIAACSDEQPAAPAASGPAPAETSTAPETPVAEATPEVPTESVEQLSERADDAVVEQRLFIPAGDNAFELYLKVLDAKPDHTNARNAIIDLYPYAVMHVEQRLGANDPADAARVLALMQKANPAAPALPRLQTALSEAQGRSTAAAAAEAARLERAAQQAEAAATTPTAPAPIAPAPAPVATAPAPVPTPAAPTVAPPTASATPPPPVATPTPPPPAPAPARASGLPAVTNQVNPRYPPLALRRRVEGYVEVSFTVLPDGTVADVAVVSSEPRSMFDREAVNAMQRWRFAPSGQESRGRRTFDFKLSDD